MESNSPQLPVYQTKLYQCPTELATAQTRNASPPNVEELTPHFPDLEILDAIGAGGMGTANQRGHE